MKDRKKRQTEKKVQEVGGEEERERLTPILQRQKMTHGQSQPFLFVYLTFFQPYPSHSYRARTHTHIDPESSLKFIGLIQKLILSE